MSDTQSNVQDAEVVSTPAQPEQSAPVEAPVESSTAETPAQPEVENPSTEAAPQQA